MITYVQGDLFKSDAVAWMNAVNTVGIMGKGIALLFKNSFPENFRIYAKACSDGQFGIGQMLITEETSAIYGRKIIINFPTKTHWKKPSEYAYVEAGLQTLAKEITNRQITSVAIPALGSGLGGLDWHKVKLLIEKHLSAVDSDMFVYEPL